MFKRRVPKTFSVKVRDFVWPRPGWRRLGRLYALKLYRLQGTAGTIAAGFGCGAAVSFLPLVGFHFLAGAALAWALRANVLASAIGTIIGNPWTFPFIWILSWHTGTFLLGQETQSAHALDFGAVFAALWEGVITTDAKMLAENVWPVWWPMLVGSLPWALTAWAACYFPLKRLLTSYDRIRTMRRLERLAALTQTGTGTTGGEGTGTAGPGKPATAQASEGKK
ncbi:hypothetical protein C882_3819 [Caenispirillum salinarum AK4]|uniref:DUF2062 domain-containing protein n=1 Tax=Caenispirillum salinarum AK4 TaxID=1238182 RepID=K9HT05_9PROT|nr:DUF2062 domain-containing protein [Caenispirillum salinarum]EKV31446.1 hypothetical protein C882_3819 [Caenispirillum salinarum AK4]